MVTMVIYNSGVKGSTLREIFDPDQTVFVRFSKKGKRKIRGVTDLWCPGTVKQVINWGVSNNCVDRRSDKFDNVQDLATYKGYIPPYGQAFFNASREMRYNSCVIKL